MDAPLHVDEREQTLVVAIRDEGITPVRLTVEKAWVARNGVDGVRDVVPALTDEAVAHLEDDDE